MNFSANSGIFCMEKGLFWDIFQAVFTAQSTKSQANSFMTLQYSVYCLKP
jgi:hypothetical protein